MKAKIEITHTDIQRLKTSIKVQSGGAKKTLSRLGSAFFITDRGTADTYAELLPKDRTYVINTGKGGDISKIGKIVDFLKEKGCTDDCCIVAFGDGSVYDVAGLAAAAYMWGIPWYIIPSTLLSMVNSPMAGKLSFFGTGTPAGLYYPPVGVIIDPELLACASDESYREGVCEIIRVGLIADKALFRLMRDNHTEIMSKNTALLEEAIFRAALVKSTTADCDGKRFKNMQAGYLLGHAVSGESDGDVPFAEAMLTGLCMETVIGCEMKIAGKKAASEIVECLTRYGVSAVYKPEHIDSFIERLDYTPGKNENEIKMPVLKKIGKTAIFKIDKAKFEGRLRSMLSGSAE